MYICGKRDEKIKIFVYNMLVYWLYRLEKERKKWGKFYGV